MNVPETCRRAKADAVVIAGASEPFRRRMLLNAADRLEANTGRILAENRRDLVACMRDDAYKAALRLGHGEIAGMASCLRRIAELPAVGEGRTPRGVIGVFFEARPTLTSLFLGLCIKSGNGAVLRGSKDAFLTNLAIVDTVKDAIADLTVTPDFLQVLSDCTREGAAEFAQQNGAVDLLIARTGDRHVAGALLTATIPFIRAENGGMGSEFEPLEAQKLCFGWRTEDRVPIGMETLTV